MNGACVQLTRDKILCGALHAVAWTPICYVLGWTYARTHGPHILKSCERSVAGPWRLGNVLHVLCQRESAMSRVT